MNKYEMKKPICLFEKCCEIIGGKKTQFIVYTTYHIGLSLKSA